MNANIKKNINVIGKIGRIIAGIMAVCMIIVGCVTAIAAGYIATLPKESVDISLNGTADITSEGQLFAKIRKVLDLKQEGDGAQLNLAGTGDVDVVVAGDDNILEGADLTETENGLKLTVNNKKFTVSTAKVLYAVCMVLAGIICSVVVLFMLKSLMKALEKCDTPFSAYVIEKMKRFGYSLIPFAVFNTFSDNSWSSIFSGELKFGFSLDITVILGILVIFLLVTVFNYGAQLQKESDETL